MRFPRALVVLRLLVALALMWAGLFPIAATDAQETSSQIVAAPPARQIDWDKLTQEGTEFLSRYIKINTTNPPGNEMEAAKLLKDKFLSEGIAATIWEPAPGRGVVAARLRGVGKKKKDTLILLSHMDVVPAVASEWKVPPFSGEVKDGYLWGRGAIDDKGPGTIGLMAMLAIKRSGILLNRDVLFVATGDEEEGGKLGAGWFSEHEKDIFSDAGFLLNEGGGIVDLPRRQRNSIRCRSRKKSRSGFASPRPDPKVTPRCPRPKPAVTRLIRALAKVIEYRSPIRVLGPVADEFHTIAELEHGPPQWLDLAASLHNDFTFLRQFLSDPIQNAKVRSTLSPTVLSGSDKTNIIPAVAYAEIDCRLLPGDDQKEFLDNLKKIINDKSIKIDVILSSPPTPPSPSKSILMKAIEELAHGQDNARVVPTMSVGFTDSRYFRRRNVVAYGLVPIELALGEARGVHGIDERIEIKELGAAIKRMTTLLQMFSAER